MISTVAGIIVGVVNDFLHIKFFFLIFYLKISNFFFGPVFVKKQFQDISKKNILLQ